MRRIAIAAVVCVCAPLAYGQGEPSSAPANPNATTPSAGSNSATAAANEAARIKELVDRELARILEDRAARDAASRAAHEGTDQPVASPVGANGGTIAGENGFMDTRLAFTLTNENMLVQPGDTIPSVPGWRFGEPSSLGVLFFDNYDTRYSGFETMSHAVLYRDFHHDHWDAEASVVVRINELSGSDLSFTDDGSYLVISNWKDPTHRDPTRISLTAFPFSADRFRLGYSYRLSWGGDPEYANAQSATPGAKLQYDTEHTYSFVGAKSAVILDQRTQEEKSALAALAGAGIDPTSMLRFEINGGYFDRGYNPLVDVDNQKVQLFGASAQISLHKGMPVESSLDYQLYKFNGERVTGLFDPVYYPGGVSWLAMSEFTVIGQTLKDPERTGVTDIQPGMAGDVNVRVMIDRVRLRFDASYRDLAFILHSFPSLPTYESFPSNYQTKSDLFVAAGLDRNWNDFLTLGLVAGIERPASLTSPEALPNGTTGPETVVISNNNVNTTITVLPPGGVLPQVAVKGTAKVTFGRIYSFLLELFYSHDANTTAYRPGCSAADACPIEPSSYVFANPNQLGVNATLQARF